MSPVVASGATPTPGPVTDVAAEPTFSARRSLKYLDGIRGIAVIFIFVRHAWGLSVQPELYLKVPGIHTFDLTPYVCMMQNGVDLFFVLSGFLLARKWFVADYTGRPRPSLLRYARTRFFRIAPPYWIALVLVLTAGMAITPRLIAPHHIAGAKGVAEVATNATFTQALLYPGYGSFGIATPFWTLTVEVIFYLVLPLLVLAFLRNRWLWALPGCLAVTLGWLAYVRWSGGWLVSLEGHLGGQWLGANEAALRYFLAKQFPAHLTDFAVGMVVANLDVRRELGRTDRLTRALTGRFAGWVSFVAGSLTVVLVMRALGTLSLQHSFFNAIPEISPDTHAARAYYFLEEWPSGLGFALLIHGVACLSGRVQRALSVRALTVFGLLGYSIYLFHMPVIWLVNRHLYSFGAVSPDPFKHWGQNLLFAGVVTFAFAALYYRLVERPFQEVGLREPRAGRSDVPTRRPGPTGPAT
jgi:peptidoglycan/LPS O-acetylase OafA/YrhL